ncbi:MAG: DUF1015 domain-containing protein [Candidatus Methylomirabilales bacterium]
MARVLPFRGHRYRVETVGDLAAVVSPPYDVISDELRHALHRRHPHNIIRLILGEDRAGDGPEENRYRRAARYFQEWEATGIVLREAAPAFYIYEQEYPWKQGERRTRIGLIGAVGLEEYGAGVIFPHEQTLPGPKADRLRLMQALPVDLEQIFCFYPGPSGAISDLLRSATRTHPLGDFVDEADVRHRLWALQDAAAIAKLILAFRERPLFIADGHHRYETALTFREEMRRTDTTARPEKAYNFVMMTLVSIEDRGLTVLPTHRLIRSDWSRGGAEILGILRPHFHCEERRIGGGEGALQKILKEMEEQGRHGHVFGLYTGGETVSLVTPKDPRVAEELIAPGRSHHAPVLDVVIVDRLVFRRLLGLEGSGMIGFTQDEDVAFHEVRHGRAAAAFFLNPTPLEQVAATVTAGERLPPKSTYFYPKLVSGLVCLKVDPDEVLEASKEAL